MRRLAFGLALSFCLAFPVTANAQPGNRSCFPNSLLAPTLESCLACSEEISTFPEGRQREFADAWLWLRCGTILTVPPKSPTTVETPVLYWFDEKLSAGSKVIELLVTDRAFFQIMDILRIYLKEQTMTWRPQMFPLKAWIESEMRAELFGSLVYWSDETLSDATLVGRLYLTPRAYQQTYSILVNHLTGKPVRDLGLKPKRSKIETFLTALGAAMGGALAGYANYYAVIQPRYYEYSAAWQLQRLNSTLGQVQSQLQYQNLLRQQALDQQQWAEWSRLLQRYRTGRWP